MIPKTFSAPPDATWPHLAGYAPTFEDALRYAVWLMFVADDVVRNDYSYVTNNAADAPQLTRIVQQNAHGDPETGALTLPQLVVGVAVPSLAWKFATGAAGQERVTIGLGHLEAVDTAWLETDVTKPPLTPETRMGRWREILMRGTLYAADREPHTSLVIDPYRTPRNEDGSYDMGQLKVLSNTAPDIKATTKRVFPNRVVKSEAELLALDPVRDYAVSYGLLATYTVDVRDRENLRAGGYE